MTHKLFLGSVHSFEILSKSDPKYDKVRDDVTILKTFFINDKVNKNYWQTTWEGMKEDAKELPGVPLVLNEDLQHPKYSVQDMYQRGTIIDYDIDEEKHQIIVYIRLTDESTISRIKSGELQYVSPAVIPRSSEDIRKVGGVDILDRSVPIHLCIVGDPAYDTNNAKMTHLCTGDGQECYHRLKIMKASKLIIKDDVEDSVKSITKTPFLRKMIAATNRAASDLLKIKTASKYHIHDSMEGYWFKARNMDVFVGRNNSIQKAINEQCGCELTAAKKKDTKGSWITINGAKVFIPDGADKGEVVNDFLDKKEKSESKNRSDNQEMSNKNIQQLETQKKKIEKSDLPQEQKDKMTDSIEDAIDEQEMDTEEVDQFLKKYDKAMEKIKNVNKDYDPKSKSKDKGDSKSDKRDQNQELSDKKIKQIEKQIERIDNSDLSKIRKKQDGQ